MKHLKATHAKDTVTLHTVHGRKRAMAAWTSCLAVRAIFDVIPVLVVEAELHPYGTNLALDLNTLAICPSRFHVQVQRSIYKDMHCVRGGLPYQERIRTALQRRVQLPSVNSGYTTEIPCLII